MKKFSKATKFIKNNLTSLIFFMILLVLVLIVILVVSVLLPTTSTSNYGDRLEGIGDVAVSNSVREDIAQKLEDNDIVDKADISISGRIININIELKGSGTIEAGKVLGASIITEFKEDIVAYYDFQVFVTSAGGDGYTVIGYKVPTAVGLSWTNN